MLESEAVQNFDLLAIDAFSGDSIPTHLLTIEAMRPICVTCKATACSPSTLPTAISIYGRSWRQPRSNLA
ncbi:MAG: hypothetical protein V5B38_12610 [Candidatus Accumulibacter propinquus]